MAKVLFRAVSQAEFVDILNSGGFRICPISVEGKYFAETVEHAIQWGKKLYHNDNFLIIAVELPPAEIDKLFRLENLDDIGPARFAELKDLQQAVITVVK